MTTANRIQVTVFTPTYNRARTLQRAFLSLCRQTGRGFEWLVVDDGSTDETPVLLDQIAKSAQFPIRVIRQQNGGKHRAHNAAIKTARGELTIILDSDDELAPEAIRSLVKEWDSIPLEERRSIAGVLGHSARPSGGLVGKRLPFKYVDGRHFELAATGVMSGDKLPCYRTDVLREFPFPERVGCNGVVPEGTVWLRIGASYKVRCIDRVVLICHSDNLDPMSLMHSYERPDSNAWGSMQYCLVVLNLVGEYCPRFLVQFLKASVNCTRYALHSGSPCFGQFTELNGRLARIAWAVGIPLGIIVWAADRIRLSV